MTFGAGVGSCMYAAFKALSNIVSAILSILVYVIFLCVSKKVAPQEKTVGKRSGSGRISGRAKDAPNVGKKIIKGIVLNEENDERVQRVVRAEFTPFEIETKRSIGRRFCGKRVDRIAMDIVRGGRRLDRLGGVSLLTLVGMIGLVLSWCATFKYLPPPLVHCGVLAVPNCVVTTILLQETLMRRLIGRFETFYLLCNIAGIFVSLGRLLWDYRIATLAYALPDLLLSVFLDASPMAYRHRIYIMHWALILVTLLLTQYLLFNESTELTYGFKIGKIEWSVPITHVASSCNINMILLSGQSLHRIFAKPHCMVLLTAPVQSVKLPDSIVDLEKNLSTFIVEEVAEEDREEEEEETKSGTVEERTKTFVLPGKSPPHTKGPP